MSSQPLVSIVLCTYNGAAYLAEQIDTLLAQTYPNLELVICDDASTDATWPILERYAARDERIHLYRNERNLGFNKNFELAISKATGDWCALSDQDDLWAASKIEKLMNHASGCVLVHGDSNMFATGTQPSDKRNSQYQKFEGTDARKNFLYNTFEGHCLLVRRDVALQCMPFPQDVYYDWWLGVNAAVKGGVCWVNEVLTFRRLHQSNASEAIYQQERRDKSRLHQAIRNITTFLTIPEMPADQKQWGEELKQCLELRLTGNSKPLVNFLFTYRNLIFFYKRNKVLPYLSHMKAIKRLVRN